MAGAVLESEASDRRMARGRLALGGLMNGPGGLTPSRQFYILVCAVCLVGALVLSLSVSLLVQQFIFDETRDLTVAAVDVHFRAAFGDDIFLRPFSEEELAKFDRMVRGHFDLYDIVQVRFYRPDGYITFSYTPELVNQSSPEGTNHDKLRRAFNGQTVMSQESLSESDNDRGRGFSDVFEIYVPVRSGGRVVGVAEVYRNIEQLMVNVRYMQGFVTSTIVIAGFMLFLSLRQIFHSSTQRIASQSSALRTALREVESTYHQTLETLSVVLDARDAETEGHSRRVSEFAVTIAKEIGISGLELEDIARGSLLHDIGKISVPDSILLKPGPLSDSEWVEMRKHPDVGDRMLLDIEFLRGALPVVRYHHEHFDGSGYPYGLKGDQIPLCARVFAVADALDAMTSDRPYRKARPLGMARQEILSESGKQFDPQVVAAFADVPANEWMRIASEVAAKRGSVWAVLHPAAT